MSAFDICRKNHLCYATYLAKRYTKCVFYYFVMTWCCWAPSHYLIQYWPWSTMPCDINRAQLNWCCYTLNFTTRNEISTMCYHQVQYIPRNMHTVFALLWFVVVIDWLIFPYPSGLLHWHCGNLTIAPVPAKQPWWIWINTSCEFIMNDCITTTKQSTTKPCAYFLGYTVDITWVLRHLTWLLVPNCIPEYNKETIKDQHYWRFYWKFTDIQRAMSSYFCFNWPHETFECYSSGLMKPMKWTGTEFMQSSRPLYCYSLHTYTQ